MGTETNTPDSTLEQPAGASTTPPAPTTPANQPAPAPATPSPTAGANAGNGEARFTQADLDKVAGQTRKEARNAAQEALLKALGVDSLEAAQSALNAATALQKAQLTEQERIKQERDEFQRKLTEAETQRQTAETQRQTALVEAAIVAKASGRFADPQAVVKLLDAGAVKYDAETGKVVGVDAALDALAKSSPWALAPTKPTVPAIGPTNPDAPATPAKVGEEKLRQDYFGGAKRSAIFGS